jgi:hypothetical protein
MSHDRLFPSLCNCPKGHQAAVLAKLFSSPSSCFMLSGTMRYYMQWHELMLCTAQQAAKKLSDHDKS